MIDRAQVEFNIAANMSVDRLGGIAASAVDHFGSHVDADGLALRTDLLRRQENIETAAAAQVHHGFTGAEACEGSRIAARQAQIGAGRNVSQLFGRVSERLGDLPHAGVLAGKRAGRGRRIVLANFLDDGIRHHCASGVPDPLKGYSPIVAKTSRNERGRGNLVAPECEARARNANAVYRG
jgi:hypothetical protein